MSIVDVIERVRREPPYVAPNDLFPDNPLECKVFAPVAWNRTVIEQTIGVVIPPALAELWNVCGGMVLYGDELWIPGGLVICPPSDELFELNRDHLELWESDVLRGDLIVGRIRGEGTRILLRCDDGAPDYGSVIIVNGDDPRAGWKTAATSLEEFLVKYMDARGEKYWTYHYQKKLAERAAQQNPEGK